MVTTSFVSIWREMARLNPNEPAVSIGDLVTLSWGELHSRTNRLARLLEAKGVGVGDLVTIALPTGAKAVEAIVATIKLGATPSVISSRLPPPERRQIIELADPRIVIDESGDKLTEHNVLSGWEDLETYAAYDLPAAISPCSNPPTSAPTTPRPNLILSLS